MPNLMQRGADWLGQRLKTAAGRTVTILRRGTIIGTGITAWVAFQDYQLVDESNVVTSTPVWDWTFAEEDLTTALRDGDRIAEVLDGVTVQYEVLPIGSMQSVTPLDSSGVLILVHTKKVS
jgi:hypothetical protein